MLEEIPLSGDSNYTSKDPNVSADMYLTRGGNITSQVIKHMSPNPSLFHTVTSQEICTKNTILSE